MVIRALITLLTFTILLPIAASRYFTLVVDVEELALFALLALILHPVDTNGAFDLRLIFLLFP